MNHNTKSYTQETPAWLWEPWTGGPGSEADRYAERLNALMALDVLSYCPEQLEATERREARRLVREVCLDGV